MTKMKLYQIGEKTEAGVKEVGELWAPNKREALAQAREFGNAKAAVVIGQVTDNDRIIGAQTELIESLMDELDAVGNREHIGMVAVDSGQLMITDPAYVNSWNAGEYMHDTAEVMNDYDAACKASLSEKGHGQILRGFSLAFSSGYGDGMYDVYAVKDEEGGIIKVEIDMAPEELEIPEKVIELAVSVFGDENFTAIDWDLRNLSVIRDGQEYAIRTWNITDSYVDWTLFKSVGNHGEEVKSGRFTY